MDAFNQIHKAGVIHGDVAERNVLVDKEGRVSVIDFEEALKLECDRARPIPGLGDFGPDKDDFNCDELWELGWAMRMWKPCMHCTPLFSTCSRDLLLSPVPYLGPRNSDDRALRAKNPPRGLQRPSKTYRSASSIL